MRLVKSTRSLDSTHGEHTLKTMSMGTGSVYSLCGGISIINRIDYLE